MLKPQIALVYIRNGQELVFPVKNLNHAVQIADAIADSDLLNDDVDYNMFDVCDYTNGRVTDAWENDEGLTFEEYWEQRRNKEAK